ncbi:hypothetical protein RB195_008941 [Necator americanus]|uniref:Peptidase S1 domain-containing protein n=1 Tax=Necator americanus TaxID=51031 RepID=A0ABR1CR26_NECAM
MRFLLCILFSAFLFTAVKSLIATNVYNPTTCGLPGPGFKGNKLRAKARRYVGNDVKRIVKRDIDKDYSVDYNPTAGDETEEDENDPMQTKMMGGQRAAKDEVPWAAVLLIRKTGVLCGGTLISRRHIITAAHCFMRDLNGTCSVENMLPEEDLLTGTVVAIGGTCLDRKEEFNCSKEDKPSAFHIKRASYRSFFESGSDYTRDFAILELTDDVPKHIHHICLPHMNKNIGIGDSSLRMSSFGWGSDPTKNLTVVPFLRKVMLVSRCSFGNRVFEKGDSGGGVTAKIGYRTYLVGVLSRGTPCKDLYSGRQEPKAQLHTDITKYTALIDSWLGAKKPK